MSKLNSNSARWKYINSSWHSVLNNKSLFLSFSDDSWKSCEILENGFWVIKIFTVGCPENEFHLFLLTLGAELEKGINSVIYKPKHDLNIYINNHQLSTFINKVILIQISLSSLFIIVSDFLEINMILHLFSSLFIYIEIIIWKMASSFSLLCFFSIITSLPLVIGNFYFFFN